MGHGLAGELVAGFEPAALGQDTAERTGKQQSQRD
jgi:hypothetical protein